MYVCLTLIAQGETLGILFLQDGRIRVDRADEARMAEKAKLAKILADNIGLGIANLKLRESMRNLSIRDALTGLFNRRYMQEALEQEQHRTRRNSAQLALVMIDIDHFKHYNDTFGHDGGDAVLRALGAFLRSQRAQERHRLSLRRRGVRPDPVSLDGRGRAAASREDPGRRAASPGESPATRISAASRCRWACRSSPSTRPTRRR